MMYSAKSNLASICDIQTGYTARTSLRPTKEGGVPAIQLRDLQGDGEFDPAGLPSYALSGSFDRYWAKSGDVLFRSRGERNTAVPIASNAKGAAIAVLPLLVLRPDPQTIDPHYLAWFINQPHSQRYFDKCARGTRLRMIPKNCVDDLEIAVPDIETQRLIVAIDALARREQALTTRLAEKRLELTTLALLRQVRDVQLRGPAANARSPT